MHYAADPCVAASPGAVAKHDVCCTCSVNHHIGNARLLHDDLECLQGGRHLCEDLQLDIMDWHATTQTFETSSSLLLLGSIVSFALFSTWTFLQGNLSCTFLPCPYNSCPSAVMKVIFCLVYFLVGNLGLSLRVYFCCYCTLA